MMRAHCSPRIPATEIPTQSGDLFGRGVKGCVRVGSGFSPHTQECLVGEVAPLKSLTNHGRPSLLGTHTREASGGDVQKPAGEVQKGLARSAKTSREIRRDYSLKYQRWVR